MALSKEELDVYVMLVAAAVAAGEVPDEKITELVQCINAHRNGQYTVRRARATAEGYRCRPNSKVVLHGLANNRVDGACGTLKNIIEGKASVYLDEPLISGTGDNKRTVLQIRVPVHCIKREEVTG